LQAVKKDQTARGGRGLQGVLFGVFADATGQELD
jgi:hypothetical protein